MIYCHYIFHLISLARNELFKIQSTGKESIFDIYKRTHNKWQRQDYVGQDLKTNKKRVVIRTDRNNVVHVTM